MSINFCTSLALPGCSEVGVSELRPLEHSLSSAATTADPAVDFHGSGTCFNRCARLEGEPRSRGRPLQLSRSEVDMSTSTGVSGTLITRNKDGVPQWNGDALPGPRAADQLGRGMLFQTKHPERLGSTKAV